MGKGEDAVIESIESIEKLFDRKLEIPDYQRPYRWTVKNMGDLLSDIDMSMKRRVDLADAEDFRYRFGTIILHFENEKYYIVDGQQRIISLWLIRRYLHERLHNELGLPDVFDFIEAGNSFSSKITQTNLHNNYSYVKDWFAAFGEDNSKLQPFWTSFNRLFEVVVITVNEVEAAFQLFDSQNTRGKEPDPHDLLKAYHLREMNGNDFEMRRAVTKWEAVESSEIKELFGKYLFPITRWANGEKAVAFTTNEIATFKGISKTTSYPFTMRTLKAMPSYQISEPFIAGSDFFSMVDYYLSLLEYVRDIARRIKSLSEIQELPESHGSVGYAYTKNLFECALLCYCDKFGVLDDQGGTSNERAFIKLMTWSFMLRVDMESLGFNSINRYATANGYQLRNVYTNLIPVFQVIRKARSSEEISNLQVKVRREPDRARDSRWDGLYEKLKTLNGISGE